MTERFGGRGRGLQRREMRTLVLVLGFAFFDGFVEEASAIPQRRPLAPLPTQRVRTMDRPGFSVPHGGACDLLTLHAQPHLVLRGGGSMPRSASPDGDDGEKKSADMPIQKVASENDLPVSALLAAAYAAQHAQDNPRSPSSKSKKELDPEFQDHADIEAELNAGKPDSAGERESAKGSKTNDVAPKEDLQADDGDYEDNIENGNERKRMGGESSKKMREMDDEQGNRNSIEDDLQNLPGDSAVPWSPPDELEIINKWIWLERIGFSVFGGAMASAILLGVHWACSGEERCSLPRVTSSWAGRLIVHAKWSRIRRFSPLLYAVMGYGASAWLTLSARKNFDGVLKIDRTTSLFLQGLIKWTSLAFIASLILKLFGIHLAGMDGLLASVGIALGLASQRVLQNLAAGITLLLFRPFKVGDKVVLPSGKGHAEGYVKDILLFETRVLTADKRLISIPNAAIYADGHIENLYGNRVRRVEILVQTAGMTNVTDARRVLEEAILPYAYLAEDRSEEDKSAEREQSKGLAGSIVRRSKEKIKKHLSGLHMPGGVLRAEVPDMIVAMTSFYMMQRAKPQADPPNPPRVVMIGMSQVGTNWLCFVWVPCREYDKWKLTVTEVIAKALQANKIRTVAQMVDQAAMNGVVLPNVFE